MRSFLFFYFDSMIHDGYASKDGEKDHNHICLFTENPVAKKNSK